MTKREQAGILRYLNHTHTGDVIEHEEYGEITVVDVLSFRRIDGEDTYRVRARVRSGDGRERVVPLTMCPDR
jgi:hypothetical protein